VQVRPSTSPTSHFPSTTSRCPRRSGSTRVSTPCADLVGLQAAALQCLACVVEGDVLVFDGAAECTGEHLGDVVPADRGDALEFPQAGRRSERRGRGPEPSWDRERLTFRPPRLVGRWCARTWLLVEFASCRRWMSGIFRGCTRSQVQGAAPVSVWPWRIGAITAALVLLHHQHGRTTRSAQNVDQ
jgi:hypothetical protein